MTMHLEGPWLSTGGKRKGKQKFRNATEAQKAREHDQAWKELKIRWGVELEEKKRNRAMKAEPLVYSLNTPIGRTNTKHIKSLDTGHSGPVSSKPSPQYTGSKILGIATLHKSNAVPVFSSEEAHDISKMRR
jgi:hypothetical protein